MALSNKDLPRPFRRKQVVEIEGMGEFIVQALSLTDRLKLQMELHNDDSIDYADRIHWILHRSVVNPDGTPFWSEEEWQDFGSDIDGNVICSRLFRQTHDLFMSGGEKKDSPETSSLPSGSHSPSEEQ